MKKIIVFFALLGILGQANAGKILLTQFEDRTDVYAQMEANLEAAGHTVDIVVAATGGSLAAALGATTYDQVFLFDLTHRRYLNTADLNAVSNFWSTDMGLVVDTRSYGYRFQGSDPSEVNLLQNIAENLDLSGGGLWIGSDHAPMWTNNANAALAAIGVNQITGIFSDPVNFADPTSVLLDGVTPSDLWGGDESVGQAPIGLQPNGIDMFIHFGHTRTDGSILPYISASFDLTGPEPVPVAEPGSLVLLGGGLWLLGIARRRRGNPVL